LAIRQIELHNIKQGRPHFALKWLLAQLALKQFPKVACDPFAFVSMSLGVEPLRETAHMDLAHTASTFTRANQLVVLLFLS
jgi:hypothetical protein